LPSPPAHAVSELHTGAPVISVGITAPDPIAKFWTVSCTVTYAILSANVPALVPANASTEFDPNSHAIAPPDQTAHTGAATRPHRTAVDDPHARADGIFHQDNGPERASCGRFWFKLRGRMDSPRLRGSW